MITEQSTRYTSIVSPRVENDHDIWVMSNIPPPDSMLNGTINADDPIEFSVEGGYMRHWWDRSVLFRKENGEFKPIERRHEDLKVEDFKHQLKLLP